MCPTWQLGQPYPALKASTWRPLGDSYPSYLNENEVSWTGLDEGGGRWK